MNCDTRSAHDFQATMAAEAMEPSMYRRLIPTSDGMRILNWSVLVILTQGFG